MALEKLTIRDEYTLPDEQPEVYNIEIDFEAGKESLAGDERLVRNIKSQAEYMPNEPCQSAFRIECAAVATWTAQPFTNKDDFKVLLFVMELYIENDRKIEWVRSGDEVEDHIILEDDAFAEDLAEVRRAIAQEERDSKLIAAQNPPPYNTKKP